MPGEAAHVGLVDDEVLGGDAQRGVVGPVEVLEADAGAVLVAAAVVRLHAPHVAAGDQPGVGVGEDLAGVEAVAGDRVVGAVGPVAVLDVLVVEAEDGHGEHAAGAEFLGELQFGHRLGLSALVDDQGHGGGLVGEDGEADPAGDHVGPEGERFAGADAVPAHLVGRIRVDAQDLLGPGLAHRAALALAAAAAASPVSKKSRKPVADMTNRTSSLTP